MEGVVALLRFQGPIHGDVEDYPHGYDRRLTCPLCSAFRQETVRSPVVEDGLSPLRPIRFLRLSPTRLWPSQSWSIFCDTRPRARDD